MTKVSISFPVKSAAQVASRLGVSKSRKNRIFTIVAQTLEKNGRRGVRFHAKRKSKDPVIINYAVKTSRSGLRSNAKKAKTAR